MNVRAITADESNQAKIAQETIDACGKLIQSLHNLAKSTAYQGDTQGTWRLIQNVHNIESLERQLSQKFFR